MPSLRDYQTQSVNELRQCISRGARAPLIVMPTGSGKTVVFSSLVEVENRRQRRILIVAHRKELIRQAGEKLDSFCVPSGTIAPWAPEDFDERVQVGSIQTLIRRLDRLPRFDVIIIDEAHHSIAKTYRRLLTEQPDALVIGVTATPERKDGKGLGKGAGGVFDHLVIGPTVHELIDRGYLSPAITYAPPVGPDLSGIRTVAGDYDAAGLERRMNSATITGDAVEHYTRLASGLPAIAFCVSIDHAKAVAETFRTAGWKATAVWGDMPADERDASIRGLETGEVQVLCNCSLVSEGLDVPKVGCVILLRPTRSLGVFMQQVGRGLRIYDGKKHLVVLDHAGNTLRHGLITDTHQWSLEGRPKSPRPQTLTRCPSCGLLHQLAPVCPECGYSYSYTGDREVKLVDGTLEIALPSNLRRIGLTGREKMADLRKIAERRGYKPGWCWHAEKEIAAALAGAAR